MERNGIDKLKKACIILPLVVAVIFNSSVAAIDRENNSKLSCGIDSYYVKDMIGIYSIPARHSTTKEKKRKV